METQQEVTLTHQAIGEFVIVFQWAEHLYRQVGWRILDPEQKEWPPTALRKESNHDLINKVTDLFIELTTRYAFPNGEECSRKMDSLRAQFHELRRYRNKVLHSAFVELKAGGEVRGYLRTNPEIGADPETGELIYDQEQFTSQVVHDKLKDFAQPMMALNLLHSQLIQWLPFERHGNVRFTPTQKAQ